MIKKSLFLGLISLILAFSANAQIVTKYQQGFEATGETGGYTVVSGTATPVSTVASSGSRSLKMQHSTSGDVVVMLDTIDFTDNGSYQYFYLEFMHICDVNPLTCAAPNDVASIEVKNMSASSQWIRLDGMNYYDVTWGGGSSDYVNNSSFSEQSYNVWRGTTINGTWWKRERFKLQLALGSLSLQDRKLLIRFTLKPRTTSGSTSEAWYLDNIKVQCSPNSMVLPTVNIVSYPEMESYPNSRGTRIAADFNTALSQGMCNDSVYVTYQLGASAPIRRAVMTPVSGIAGRYETYIPFCGYDTIVRWKMVGMDNTVNHNKTTFPMDESAWLEYKNVRGSDATKSIYADNAGQSALLPFSSMGDGKYEIYYDSAEMAATFKPGAITQVRYSAASNVVNSTRNRFLMQMANVPSSHAISSDNKYYTEFQKTVYDSSLVITQNNGTTGVIYLQDTFFYAGSGLLITITTHNQTADPTALSVRTCPAGSSSVGSLQRAYNTSNHMNPFDASQAGYYTSGSRESVRPNFTFVVNRNAPLYYDCGISGFINPNDSTPANAVGNNDVVVTLKNYGSETLNNVRIYYSVDNGMHQYYDWSGSLAGGATTNVTISTTQTYPAGYHEMLAWVDDSVTSAGVRYRDHEPFNDTLWTRFISCDGPISGVRTVGGSTPDYASLEKMLYALSQCGINGPLTVKLAPGYYMPHTFPVINGVSATNYIQFEPLSGSVQFVSALTDTTLVNSLVNLQQAHHIRFKNISFLANTATNPATYLVRMATNSRGCQFIGCTFNESVGFNLSESYMRSSALLYSGGADSLTVDSCTFLRGSAGVSLVGPAQDNMANGSKIYRSSFANQGVNSMVVRNQVNAEVDSNVCNGVYANSSYAILLQDCSGATRVTRNTVYVTSGASGIGATNFFGSPSGYAVVANNMIVSNDDGTSNMLTTPLNIITADYTKVLFNSVKLTAPTRSGIAAATFGGGVLSNSYFYNNIVSCYDTVNFAFNYIPTDDSINYIGYNIYYSRSALLNKYDGINCYSLNNWTTHCTMDGNSQFVNPAFLVSTPTDLRSYSQNVKNHGVHFNEVTNDIYGSIRNSTTPCVGAFEFSALPYDFEVIDYLEPYDEYCDAPTSVPLRVVVKNSGVNAFDPSTSNMYFNYARSYAPGVMTPGVSGSVLINRTIPALDTIVYNTGITLPFPTNGYYDTTYTLYTWFTSSIDPNPANDTSFTTVTAHYHQPAPDSVITASNYGAPATVSVTAGLQNWYGNVYTQGVSHTSEVYWYLSPESTTPFWRGNTLTTDPLYVDTSFYVRQQRDYPLVRITEVQLNQTGNGVTYPQQLWMSSTTNLAIEFTNIGDYPAEMLGDTLLIVSNKSALNNKVYKFPNVTIQPGQTLVLQYGQGISSVDSTQTLATAKLNNLVQTDNMGILYKHGGVIQDAVALNNITSQTQWANQSVPATVWSGSGITIVDSIPTAGVYRKSWTNNPNQITVSAPRWQVADNEHRMTVGTTNDNLVRFINNGCLGDVAPVRISMINLPDVDIALEGLDIPDGCGVGQEPITITVHNRGSQNSGPVVLNYRVDGHVQYQGQAPQLQECHDTIAAGFDHGTTTTYTFSVTPDFSVASASVDFDVLVWVDKLSSDIASFNDTLSLSLTSMFMPDSAVVKRYDTVMYNTRAVLMSLVPPTDSLAWYDRNMNPLDTSNVFVSDYLYEPDTFYVSTFGARISNIHVGNMATISGQNNYPSPYNPKKKYVKEQYIYFASDLIAAGHAAGPIQTVSFYLDTILNPAGNVTFTDYVVSMGSTSQTNFTSTNGWLPVSTVSTIDTLTLSNQSKGWILHNLDTAFHWNGVDNIVVQVTRSINPASSQGAKTRYTGGFGNTVLYKNIDDSSLVRFYGNGSRSANRPDIQFGFVDYGCESTPRPVYIAIDGVPSSDAALEWEAEQDTGGVNTYSSCDSVALTVKVRNMGLQPFGGYTIDYWVDDFHGVYVSPTMVGVHSSVTLNVANYLFTPGRHNIRMAVTLENDTIHTNDTISRVVNVRFCAGNYTIGAGAQYANFSVALDTLTNAGVDGEVFFLVEPGTYNEQIVVGDINGVSATNKIHFRGVVNSADSVILNFAPVAANNYVVKFDGAEYCSFEWMTIRGIGAAGYSNVVVIQNSNQIRLENDYLVGKQGVSNGGVNASVVTVGERSTAVYVKQCNISGGFYGIRSNVTDPSISNGIYITDDSIVSFGYMGVYMRKVDDVQVSGNYIFSSATANSKALTGVFVAEHQGPVTIERNNVVLNDNFTGAKIGIRVVNITAANATRSHVHNNMCAIYGKNNGTSAGISVDSTTWMNLYYNTCRVYAGNVSSSRSTKSMYVGTTSSQISIMNSIFDNQSAGYALYVQLAANVASCDYNNYWSIAADRLAYWGGVEDSTLQHLINTNHKDDHSYNEKPYFVSDADLHLTMGTFCEKAQYNTETPLDIDSKIRPQIPNPCIGAHEFERSSHNIAVMEIIKPQVKKYPEQTSGFTDNVESDTLMVSVKLTNDGTATESNLKWWAEVVGVTPQLRTDEHTIVEMLPQEIVYDSAIIVMPIGVIDTQTILVHFPLTNDYEQSNNELTATFFLDPAYNFRAKQVLIYDTGCRLQNARVGVMLTNVGRKDYPAGWEVPIGFEAILQTSGITVSTLPSRWVETATLPVSVQVNADVTLDFQQTANLYPTGNDKDIVVRARAWSSHQYDQKPLNDTTSYVNHSSFYTPKSPIGIDLQIPYATWDTIFASQTDTPPGASAIHRPIYWYRDSTATHFHTGNNYAASTWWETPQYFYDSTYYLSCISAHNNKPELACTSYYSAVHVNINPRVPVDMAVLDVVEPVGNRVYMTNDSVKLSLINYGSQDMTNIPVVYELYDHNNNLLQHVQEICTATIHPDEVYVFRFDSLLSIPAWSVGTSGNNRYHLRVWTDLANENVRLNDTLRQLSYFDAVGDDVYDEPVVDNKNGLDITRVAFSSLDNTTSPAGHDYINFTNATRQQTSITNPQTLAGYIADFGGKVDRQGVGDLRALHVVKGTVDTMVVECMNSDNASDITTRGWLSVWVDVDRDGSFKFNPEAVTADTYDYSYPYTEIIYQDTIQCSVPKKFLFSLPPDVRTGYMRMRVVIEQGAFSPKEPGTTLQFGSIQDYLLYVEDIPAEEVDICAARIVAPRSQHIGGHTGYNSDDSVTVSFQIANKGRNTVTSSEIRYTYTNRNNIEANTLNWVGELHPGESTVIELPSRVFPYGVTNLKICVNTPDDTNLHNDTLYYQYYRAPLKTLVYRDNFEGLSEWFIPRGYTSFDQNIWSIGMTSKPNITACVSDSNIMATNLNGLVSVFNTGNVSYAYTPIFDISTIRPDTLELWIAKDMSDGHLARIEFCDYLGRWVTIGSGNDTLWYNRASCWDSVSAGYGYSLYRFPLSKIGGDFQQRLQLRLVYKAATESAPCDGVAVDNFVVGRAVRNIDVGVIAITYPVNPRFGDIVKPKVVVKNYGLDTLHEFQLAYLPYGVNLARTGTFQSEEGLLPGGVAVYEFPTPFTIRNDFPDTFQICAYTIVNMDMYHDNDSICQDFYLSPMENDISLISFVNPINHVVAGDSIYVTAKIRNYGENTIHNARITYIFNENFEVSEDIDFDALLGNGLQSFEYMDYTFQRKFRASMGHMNLQAYVKMDGDNYPFNDTIFMNIDGLSAITDLRVRGAVVDTSDNNTYRMNVIIENVGARAVNDFKIGFWYYKDTSTRIETIYHAERPLAALATLCYKFPDSLPLQREYYRYVTSYVYAADDSDRSNDTTEVIEQLFYDLTPYRVLIEENRNDSCRVRLEVKNVGNNNSRLNQPLAGVIVVNGASYEYRRLRREIPAGEIAAFDLDFKVPKSPTRTYVGSCTLNFDDDDQTNNVTNRIEVVNYFDGVPVAMGSNELLLQQNYPNPFENTTRIDFYLPTAGTVRFFVMDEIGRLVYQNVNDYEAGDQSLTFGDGHLTTGVYYYGIEMNGERLMRKMVLKR